MTNHMKRSRVTKAFADAGLTASFADAEARLDAVRVCVVLGDDQARTPAGQATALTALTEMFQRMRPTSYESEPGRLGKVGESTVGGIAGWRGLAPTHRQT